MSYTPRALLSAHERYRLTTEAFAVQHLVKAQSVRKQYAATGSYHGVLPLRLPNRRLLWPVDSIEQIAGSATSAQLNG
jgi:hypothetical protein